MSTDKAMTNEFNHEKYDLDRQGGVTDDEISRVHRITEVEILDSRARTQKRMAWTALISMLIFTTFLFSPMVADSRVSALADLLGLFFIAQAGIVGAYMGVTAWMSSTSNRSRSRYDTAYRTDPTYRNDPGPGPY